MPSDLPTEKRCEFEIEGHLQIVSCSGMGIFKVDDCLLSEFVTRHFGVRWKEGIRDLGRCKVLIMPIGE